MEMYDYGKAESSQNVYEEPASIKTAPVVREEAGEQSLAYYQIATPELDVSNKADHREPTHIYSKFSTSDVQPFARAAEMNKSGLKCSNLCLIITVVVLVIALASAASYVTYLTMRLSALEETVIERLNKPSPDQYQAIQNMHDKVPLDDLCKNLTHLISEAKKDARAEIQDLEDRLLSQINTTHQDLFTLERQQINATHQDLFSTELDQCYEATHQELFQMLDVLNTSVLSQQRNVLAITQAQAINITSYLTTLIAAKTNNLSETIEADVRAEIQNMENRLSSQINATHQDLLQMLNTSVLSQQHNVLAVTRAQAINITSYLTTLIAAKTNNLSETIEADVRAKMQDLEDRLSSQINATRHHSTTPAPEVQTYEDCQAAWERGVRVAGIYRLSPGQLQTFSARCEFDSSHGWTLIQRRYDGSVDFYLPWDSYKRGFGNLHGEYWLGNEKIFSLTRRNRKLSIYMMRWDGDEATANYSNFYISNESDNYRLTISGYGGNAGYDGMAYHNGSSFSTRDRDNDGSNGQCAHSYRGAWWYDWCARSNLNGLYTNRSTGDGTNMFWYGDWSGSYSRPLRRTTIMITRD